MQNILRQGFIGGIVVNCLNTYFEEYVRY